jgi:hypothetical protein
MLLHRRSRIQPTVGSETSQRERLGVERVVVEESGRWEDMSVWEADGV